MEVFLAILALVVVALVATSPVVYRLRRSRLATVMISGGWLPLGVGVLLGPEVADLIDADVVRSATPAAVVALGWIGFAVGLQVRREVLAAVPPAIVRVAGVDALVTAVAIGGLTWGVVAWWADGSGSFTTMLGAVSLIAAASLGWSLETRSLRGADSDADRAAEGAIRAGGSLLIIVAVILAGLVAGASGHGDVRGAASDLALSIGVALVLGVVGKYALGLAGNDRAQQLVVFLGLVAFVAGVAAQSLVTPMFSAMVAAAVIANLRGQQLRWFERFIFKGEPLIAAIVALLAGVLLETNLSTGAFVLIAALIAARVALKPPTVAIGAGVGRSRVVVGALRQSPIAIALGVGLVVEEGSRFSRELLSVLVLVGLASELIAIGASSGIQRSRNRAATSSSAEGAP